MRSHTGQPRKEMKMYPTDAKELFTHDHLCLGPDLPLVACLSTGVCEHHAGLQTGQGKLSCIQNQTSSSRFRQTHNVTSLLNAWTFP